MDSDEAENHEVERLPRTAKFAIVLWALSIVTTMLAFGDFLTQVPASAIDNSAWYYSYGQFNAIAFVTLASLAIKLKKPYLRFITMSVAIAITWGASSLFLLVRIVVLRPPFISLHDITFAQWFLLSLLATPSFQLLVGGLLYLLERRRTERWLTSTVEPSTSENRRLS
jgi:hypothetical protein